jgi:hypothetical protein
MQGLSPRLYTGIYCVFEQISREEFEDWRTAFRTKISRSFPQSIHSVVDRPIHSSPKHRAMIAQDHPCRIMSRGAGDAAAGVGAGAAVIEAL